MNRPTWNEAKHTVRILLHRDFSVSLDLESDIAVWLRDNIESSSFIIHTERDRHANRSLLVGFVEPAKAVLFKLTWANTEIIANKG
ncbi:hypothetical protein D3C71_1278300 [compost metagenome]